MPQPEQIPVQVPPTQDLSPQQTVRQITPDPVGVTQLTGDPGMTFGQMSPELFPELPDFWRIPPAEEVPLW
jgi:hypothetical protein